jgi:hypothetical protein
MFPRKDDWWVEKGSHPEISRLGMARYLHASKGRDHVLFVVLRYDDFRGACASDKCRYFLRFDNMIAHAHVFRYLHHGDIQTLMQLARKA